SKFHEMEMVKDREAWCAAVHGPDICGFGNKKVQVILRYQGKYHENNKTIKCRVNTHLHTLIIRPSATYEVKIDNKQVAAGDLEDNWAFLPPRKIKDPYARKPRKWDEGLQIEDPEDKKPESVGSLRVRHD
uniref:Uncharacterized protein n=1 Tax=Moschus moschiferus TaxID=68415 RepID=A0A8C6DEJ4_MOSMO